MNEVQACTVVIGSFLEAELVERISTSGPDLRVLYMSGYPEEVMEKHGVALSESTLIYKPFTAETLAHSVREALDGGGGVE